MRIVTYLTALCLTTAFAASADAAKIATLAQVRSAKNSLKARISRVDHVNSIGITGGARGKGYRLSVTLEKSSTASRKAIAKIVGKRVPFQIKVIGAIAPQLPGG